MAQSTKCPECGGRLVPLPVLGDANAKVCEKCGWNNARNQDDEDPTPPKKPK